MAGDLPEDNLSVGIFMKNSKGELNMVINNIDNISSCSDEELKVLAKQALRLNECGYTDDQPLRGLIDSDGTSLSILTVSLKIFLECTNRWVNSNRIQHNISDKIENIQSSLEELKRITSIDNVSKVSVDKNKEFKMVGNYEQGGWVCPECDYCNNSYHFKGTCEKCGFEDSNKNKYR